MEVLKRAWCFDSENGVLGGGFPICALPTGGWVPTESGSSTSWGLPVVYRSECFGHGSGLLLEDLGYSYLGTNHAYWYKSSIPRRLSEISKGCFLADRKSSCSAGGFQTVLNICASFRCGWSNTRRPLCCLCLRRWYCRIIVVWRYGVSPKIGLVCRPWP